MSAQSIRRFGFLASSNKRDPDDSPTHPAGAPVLVELLREWRAAERGLAELEPGSDQWARLQVEIERLRARYQEAFDAVNHSGPTGSAT